jgi:hypothetical protein
MVFSADLQASFPWVFYTPKTPPFGVFSFFTSPPKSINFQWFGCFPAPPLLMWLPVNHYSYEITYYPTMTSPLLPFRTAIDCPTFHSTWNGRSSLIAGGLAAARALITLRSVLRLTRLSSSLRSGRHLVAAVLTPLQQPLSLPNPRLY